MINTITLRKKQGRHTEAAEYDFFLEPSATYNLANKEKTGPGNPKDHLDDHQHSHIESCNYINNKQKVIV